MLNHIKQAAVAAAVLAAIPGLASAQTVAYGTSPVSVNSCSSSDNTTFVAPVSMAGQMLHSSNDITLGYVNTGNVAATSVKFLVNDGNQTSTVIANGTFAPGVTINRTFTGAGAGSNAASACAVAEVRFADGSVWNAAPREISQR